MLGLLSGDDLDVGGRAHVGVDAAVGAVGAAAGGAGSVDLGRKARVRMWHTRLDGELGGMLWGKRGKKGGGKRTQCVESKEEAGGGGNNRGMVEKNSGVQQ